MLSTAHRELLAAGLVRSSTLDDLPVAELRRLLSERSFACVRGLVAPAEIERAKQRWRSRFDAANDHEPDPSRPDRVRRNFQCVVDRPPDGPGGRPQFVRTFYNPLWDEDLFGMHGAFRTVVRLRNLLMGLPIHFAEESPERGVWTASRIHHYPRGIGHMAAHRDSTFSSLADEFGLCAYYQIIVLMSRRGSDFSQGGGYFVHGGERVHFEASYEPGDLVIYDERLLHGVDVIDPGAEPERRSPGGRLAAFANLYRVL